MSAIGSAGKIEERILRMKWDADDFNKAAQNTLKLLEEVKTGIKSVTDEINGRSASVDLSQINDAASKVSDSFTLMGRIAYKALDDIAEKALSVGKSVADALVIKPVASGFDEYGLLMDSTQVILSNTGRDLEDVKGALDDLNHYADKTIYNFGQMTNAIGRFSAAGVGLEDSVDAIQGLSNYSALVGANAQQNISAMDAVSKALAGGSLKLRQWMQFEAAGSLGGKLLRDQLIETGKELGVFDQAWSDATGKTIQGADLLEEAQTSLRETLKYGWVTSDVLLQTLAKFSDEETELGQKAIKAATEVRTFAKMWDALQEAVQSSWSQSFQYIFGDYEEGTKLWTAINEEVSDIIGAMNDKRNEMLEVWHDNGGRDAVLSGLSTLYRKIKKEFGSLVEAVTTRLQGATHWDFLKRTGEEFGSMITDASFKFKDWADNFEVSKKLLGKILQTLRLIVVVPLKEIQKFIDKGGLTYKLDQFRAKINIILNLLSSLRSGISKAFEGLDGLGIGELFAKYEKIVARVLGVINVLTDETGKQKAEFEKLRESGEATLSTWSDIIARLLAPARALVDTLLNVSGGDLVQIGADLYRIFTAIIDALSYAVQWVTGTFDGQFLTDFVHKFREMVASVREFLESPKGKSNLIRTFTGLLSIVGIVRDVFTQIVRALFPDLADGAAGALESVTDVLATIGDWISHIETIIREYDLVYKGITIIKAFLTPFVEFLQDTFGSILNLVESIFGVKFEIFGPSVMENTGEARSAFEEFAMTVSNNFQEITKKAYEFSRGIADVLTVVKRIIFGLIGIINQDNWIQKLGTPIKDLFNIFKNADYSPIIGVFADIARIIGVVGSAVAQATENIFKAESGVNALTSHFSIIKEIADYITGIVTSDFGKTVIERGIGSIVSFFRILYDAFAQVREFLSESGIIKDLQDLATPIIKIVGGAITYLGDIYRWLERVIRHNSLIKNGLDAIYSIIRPLLKFATKLLNSLTYTIETAFGTDLDLGNWMSRVFGSPRKHLEEFSNSLTGVFDWIKEKGKGLGEFLGVEVEGSAPMIEENKTLWETWSDTVSNAWNKITGASNDGSDENVSGFGKFLKAAGDFFTKVKDTFTKGFTWIKDNVTSLWTNSGLAEAFKNADFGGIIAGIGNAIGTVFSKIVDKIKSFFSPKEITENVKASLKKGEAEKDEAAKTIGEWFSGIIDSAKTWIYEKINGIKESGLSIPTIISQAIFGGKELENGEKSKGLIGRITAPFIGVYDSISTWFEKNKSNVDKKLAPIIEFFKPLVTSLKTIFDGIVESLPDFFSDPSGNVTAESVFERIQQMIMTFGGLEIFKLIGSFGKKIRRESGAIKQFGKGVKKLSTAIAGSGYSGGLIGDLSDSVNRVSKGLNHFITYTLNNFMTRTAKTFDKFMNKTLRKSIYRITDGFESLMKGIKKAFTDVGKGVKRYLTGKALKEAATGILLFSVAVGILAAAIFALGNMDEDKLKKGGIAVAAIVGVLTVVALLLIKALKKNNGKDGVMSVSKELKGFAGGVEVFKDGIDDVFDGFKKVLNKVANVAIIFAFVAAIKTVIDGIVKIGKLNPEQAMVGVIGVVIALIAITASMKSLMKSAGKAGNFKFRQVLGMLAMILVIRTAVGEVVKVGGMSWEEMARGVIGVSVLMIALSVVIGVMFSFAKTAKGQSAMTLRQVFGLLAMCVAISTLGNAVTKIADLSYGKMLAAGAVIGILMVVMGLVIKWISSGFGVTGGLTLGDDIGLIAMCAMIWVLGNAVKKIAKLDPEDSIRAGVIVAVLLGVVAFAINSASYMQGTGIGSFAIIGIIIGGIVAVLGYMAKHFNPRQATNFNKMATGLTKVLLSLSAVSIVAGLIGKFVKPEEVAAGIKSIGTVALIVGAIVGLITAITEVLNHFGGGLGDKIWNSIKKVLTSIGEAIGGFFGGIVGSFQSTQASHLASAGDSLGKFAESSKPFFDLVGDKKKMKPITSGIKDLASAMLSLVAGDFIKKLSVFGGDTNPFDNFQAMLGSMGTTFTDLDGVLNKVDVKKVGYAIKAMSQLIAASAKIPNQGGKIADIFGDNTLTQFAEGIKDFTKPFGDFIMEMESVTALSDAKKVKRAIGFASQVAEMSSKIPNQGGKIADFFGDNTLTQFAQGIKDFTKPFGDFIIEMEASVGAVNPETVDRAIEFAVKIADFATRLPNEGGIVADIFGDNSLKTFAEGLEAFTEPFTNFLFECERNLGATNPDTIEKALDFADRIATFANNLPKVKSLEIDAGFLTGFIKVKVEENPLLGFVTGLQAFTPVFSEFLTTISGDGTVIDDEKVTQALGYADSLAKFVNNLPEVHEVSIGDIKIFSDDKFGKFVEDLGNFGTSISTFVTKISEAKLNPVKIGLALTYTDAVTKIAEQAPKFGGLDQFIGGTTNLREFGQQLAWFAPNFKIYLETVGAAKYNESVIEKSNIAMTALAGFADTVEGKEGVLSKFFFGDSSLTGIGEGLGTFATGMTEYSTALESVNWDNIDKSTEFVTSLGELATSMTDVGSLLYIGMDEITSQIDDTLKSLSTKISGGYEKATTAKDFEEDMKSSAGHVGELISTGIENGFDETIDGSTANIDESIKGWIDTEQTEIDTKLKTTITTGASSLIDELKRTLNTITLNVGPKATENFASIAGYGVEGIRNKWTEFFNAGVYIVDGFIVGIQNKKQQAINELQDLANAATQAVTVPLQINSPSKVFERIGGFLPAGLALGVKKKAPDAIKAVKDNLARPISLIENVLNGDIEYSPRIRPVVDLDGARSSVSTLNGMFGSRTIGLADATIRTTNDNHLARINAKAAGYNDRNVVRAIQGLQADVGTLRSSINGMGLYLDSDTLVGGIVNKVDKKLGVNQLRRRRYA